MSVAFLLTLVAFHGLFDEFWERFRDSEVHDR